jgi:thiol-disulfide isomerase/thioredoxin
MEMNKQKSFKKINRKKNKNSKKNRTKRPSIPKTGGGGSAENVMMSSIPIFNPSDVVPSFPNKSLVLYHAKWCGFCNQMMPLYEKTTAKFETDEVKFYSCEDSILKKSGKSDELGISGYPTIVFFLNGIKRKELVGNVSSSEMRSFIRKLRK